VTSGRGGPQLKPKAGAIVLLVASAAAATWAIAHAQGAATSDILISRQLMESQQLHVGDVVSLSAAPSGEGGHRFRITGVYEPTPDPMRLGATRLEVRLHLPDLIDLGASRDPADRESVDAINASVQPPARLREVARRLTSGIPGIITQRTADDQRRTAPFVVLERFHFAIAIVTVLASSVFLLALMLMLVEERRSTVGILRMIGFRRGRILQHVLAEGLVIAIAGALFGILLSVVLQRAVNDFFQWRYDTALVFVRITPDVALRSIAVAVPLGVASIVASSWSLLRSEVFSLTRR
jgi:ABC-type lipoprotein release transport system permease subunit